MGTRHLICVVKDGDYKVAQYGQWDGYPAGQGIRILNFLKTVDKEKFKAQIDKVSFLSDEETQDRWIEAGAEKNSEWVSLEVSEKFNMLYPENSRDTGSQVLQIIQNAKKPIKLTNQIEFAGQSLFCEWAYVIDLDKNVFEVYKGFNTKQVPKKERFFGFEQESPKYYPVKLIAKFNLNKLPSEKVFMRRTEDTEK
jgi:hypothetical protein